MAGIRWGPRHRPAWACTAPPGLVLSHSWHWWLLLAGTKKESLVKCYRQNRKRGSFYQPWLPVFIVHVSNIIHDAIRPGCQYLYCVLAISSTMLVLVCIHQNQKDKNQPALLMDRRYTVQPIHNPQSVKQSTAQLPFSLTVAVHSTNSETINNSMNWGHLHEQQIKLKPDSPYSWFAMRQISPTLASHAWLIKLLLNS